MRTHESYAGYQWWVVSPAGLRRRADAAAFLLQGRFRRGSKQFGHH